MFDVVCMGDVLEHIPDPNEAIRKVTSILASGGLLWISTPNYKSAASLILQHTIRCGMSAST